MDTSITPENLAEDRGLTLRRSFLVHPGEAPEVDYKAGMEFISGDDFSLKLVKHILGMANAGGGYLVIGYPENTSKHPEAGAMTEQILASYDVSNIALSVEKYKAGTEKIDIKVHKDKNPVNGQIYPIIEIGSFKSRPFFCKSSAGGILEQNALYIRVAGARTIIVATPDEWDQLIDISVTKRQDEMLRRFAGLMHEMGFSSGNQTLQDEESQKKTKEWIDGARADAKAQAEAAGFKFEGFEIIHSVNTDKNWNIKELFEAMRSSALKNTGWPIGYVFQVEPYKPKPYNKGLRAIIADHRQSFDYWVLNENGDFYFFRTFQEDSFKHSEEEGPKREVWFDTQIWRISESFEHALALYRALGVDTTSKITIAINFLGINERTLRASHGTGRFLIPRTSATGTTPYEWEKNMSLDALSVNLDQNIIEVSNGLFVMFDFQEIRPDVIQGVIDEYRNSRTR